MKIYDIKQQIHSQRQMAIDMQTGVLPPQRTASSSSLGPFDGNSMSLKSVNSVSLVDVASKPEQSAGNQQDRDITFPSLPAIIFIWRFWRACTIFKPPLVQQTLIHGMLLKILLDTCLSRVFNKVREQVAVHKPPSTANQYLGLGVSKDLNEDGFQRANSDNGTPIPLAPSHVRAQMHATNHKSTNPFDLPFDSDLESSNMFLDMSSLQAALPNAQMPPSFLGGVTQPSFPQNPSTPYIPDAPQGSLGFMTGQTPSTRVLNVSTKGPVASIEGNPFA
ncbi:hypothetical protein F0562_016201 [Nyssa sinensis]|uniref:Uncharacterized protein n=1 Tax=Nyssa sinensis TaxID=561372 RepID=A0A5J4ZKA8_9ASTE|nr:hypothetical protein F0562_016201 [Nyssa sinensis]